MYITTQPLYRGTVHNVFLYTCISDNIKLLKFLLTQCFRLKQSSYVVAYNNNQINTVQLSLIDNNVDVHFFNATENGYNEIIELLIDHGANTKYKSSFFFEHSLKTISNYLFLYNKWFLYLL